MYVFQMVRAVIIKQVKQDSRKLGGERTLLLVLFCIEGQGQAYLCLSRSVDRRDTQWCPILLRK